MASNSTLFIVVAGFFAGFVDAIVGGGGLISLPTLLALNFPTNLAIGSNKIIGVAAATASSLRYGMAGKIDWKTVLPMSLSSFVCSGLGATAATYTSPTFLRPFSFITLVCVALFAFLKRDWGLMKSQEVLSNPKWKIAFGGLIGFYDGFFGPGTGAFLMVGFILLFGKELLEASANSRFVNYSSNIAAVLIFALLKNIDFSSVWPGAVASFIGSYLGANLSIKKGAKIIKPLFRIIVTLLILKVGYDLFW